MNKKAPQFVLLFALVAVLAFASPAWADRTCTGQSDQAQWDDPDLILHNSISMDVGTAGNIGVAMQSPMCLNVDTFPGILPVFIDVALDSAMCPDNSSGSTATCVLTAPQASIANNPQSYTGFGQTRTYTAHFDATNATPGTYYFHAHANASDPNGSHQNGDNLGGYGWGYGSGVQLTVIVTKKQQTCDPDDMLNVAIVQPQNNSKVTFCNGGTAIPVSITASDTSNPITSLTAKVNAADISNSLTTAGIGSLNVTATGTYTAGPVGGYSFTADAATACTTGQASAFMTLQYNISGLLGPLANGMKPRRGNNVPIQFIPKDCGGNLVPYDSSVHVMVYDSSSNLLQDATPTGCTGPSCGSGNSSYVSYDAVKGQYQSNFKTGLTAGTYGVQIVFGGVINFSTTFSTQ
jgi:hypothetical protein